MKKLLFSLALIGGMTAFVTTQQSCVSAIDAIFPGFVTEYIEVPFDIPVISSPNTGFVKLDTTQVAMNIDQMVRDNTGGAFNISNVGSISMEEMYLDIENSDPANNWGNFTGVGVYIASDANMTSVLAGTRNTMPDSSYTRLKIDVDQSLALKDYLSGNQIFYSLFGGNRRATTKIISGTAYIKYRLK
jgi:hypothetical protein